MSSFVLWAAGDREEDGGDDVRGQVGGAQAGQGHGRVEAHRGCPGESGAGAHVSGGVPRKKEEKGEEGGPYRPGQEEVQAFAEAEMLKEAAQEEQAKEGEGSQTDRRKSRTGLAYLTVFWSTSRRSIE